MGDHGDHGGGDSMSGMIMWFHFGTDETVLFDFWKTKETVTFICSLVIIFIMSFGYEALKYWRDRMLQSHYEATQSFQSKASGPPSIVSQIFNSFHIIQTLLHMVQFVLSYFLMLIFMTYNVWLSLCVTLGAGAGYFCFGWYKTHSVDITEHCH